METFSEDMFEFREARIVGDAVYNYKVVQEIISFLFLFLFINITVLFNIFQLIANKGNKQERDNAPYIAAKFPQRNIPYTFHLGNGEQHEGFVNRKLERGKKYRIFVRAVVDTPQKVSVNIF